MKFLFFIITSILFIHVVRGTCTAEDVKSYSTYDINLSSRTVFTAEFSINCDNQEKLKGNFFAQMNGMALEMAKGHEKYQITWINEHSLATPGKYELQIYDEESFTLLRKAERSGSDEITDPIFVLEINHPGARSPKPSIPIETFFILALIALMWFAYMNKSRLVE